MEFFDWIKSILDNGTVPSVLAIILAIASAVLEITKNKLAKKLVGSDERVQTLQAQVTTLITLVKELSALCENTNALTSTATDQLHMAFNNSKLSPAAKLELQKLYDACPEAASKEAPELLDVIHTDATEEQVNAIVEPEAKSYADLISDKYK